MKKDINEKLSKENLAEISDAFKLIAKKTHAVLVYQNHEDVSVLSTVEPKKTKKLFDAITKHYEKSFDHTCSPL